MSDDRQLVFYIGDRIQRTVKFYRKDLTDPNLKTPYLIPTGAEMKFFFPNSVTLDSLTSGEITFTAGTNEAVYSISKTKSAGFVANAQQQDIGFTVYEDGATRLQPLTFVDAQILTIKAVPNT